MPDQVEELINEIAAKHGITVSRDDPILILQTINNRLLEDGAKAQQAQLDLFKQELEALSMRWGNDAKGKSERILNAALAASKDAMWQIMQDGAATTVTSMQAKIDGPIAGLVLEIRDARKIGVFNLAASCVTLLAAAIVFWAAAHQ